MDLLRDLSPENKAKIDDSMGIIQLICGQINYKPFWSYVSLYPSTYSEYMDKVAAHEDINIESFGIVLHKGWGAIPPQDVQDLMKEHFGADNSFEAQLNKMAQDLEEDIEKQEAADRLN